MSGCTIICQTRPSCRTVRSSSWSRWRCWACPAWQRSSPRSPTPWSSSASTPPTMSASSSYCYLIQVNIILNALNIFWSSQLINCFLFSGSSESEQPSPCSRVEWASSPNTDGVLSQLLPQCSRKPFNNDDITTPKLPWRHHNVHLSKLPPQFLELNILLLLLG